MKMMMMFCRIITPGKTDGEEESADEEIVIEGQGLA